MKSEMMLCLFAIEQACENDDWSDDDLKTLKEMYEQGLLYSCILKNDSLCNEKMLVMVSGFCKLIGDSLLAPDIKNGLAFMLKRKARQGDKELMKLGVNMRALASTMYREVMIEFMSIFQIAILNLSLKVKDVGALSVEDTKNVHYVIGMAEITLTNIQSVFERNGAFNQEDYSNINKFFVDSTRFASSLLQRELNIA